MLTAAVILLLAVVALLAAAHRRPVSELDERLAAADARLDQPRQRAVARRPAMGEVA